jgi:ubiquinone biosynthesis accessory factor UbiJ
MPMAGPANDAAGSGPGTGPGFAGLFKPPVAAAVNHLLQGASWARERLKPFAGKTVRFNLAPFAVTLAIRDSGEVADSTAAGAADASFALTPGIALRMLAADPNTWQEVDLDGDTALAREILAIAQNLSWDIEEDLSRVFGDIVAHRMVQAGTRLKRRQFETAGSIARSAVAYWTEEQPLIASRQDIERFLRDVDALRDDVARVEQQIASRLSRQDSF